MAPLQMFVMLLTGFFIPPILTIDPPDQPATSPVIVKFHDDTGIAPARVIVKIADGNVPDAVNSSVAMAIDPIAVAIAQSPGDIKEGGPWLGIQFGPISKALAAQLGIDPHGAQMVMNVIDGSPADQAGIKQYDVILKIDGDPVTANVENFLEQVRGFEPGETHDFSIVRGGKSTQTSVTVGTRPDTGKGFSYKYKVEVPERSEGRIFQRGGILQKDKSGNWNFKRFDQLMVNMDQLLQSIPNLSDDDMAFAWQGNWPGGGNNILLHIDKGKSLRIKRDDDGHITVTKSTRENGKKETTTNTYEDEQKFEQQDPESFKSYKKSLKWNPGPGGLHMKRFSHGPGGVFMFKDGDHDFDFDFNIDIDEIRDATRNIRRKTKELHHRLRNTLKSLNQDQTQDDEDQDIDEDNDEDEIADAFSNKATTHFEAGADGSIRVIIRQGSDELVETYDNAKQLKQARPKLYEKYKRLKASSSEEDSED